MIGDALYSSEVSTWETPPTLFRGLDEEFRFTLDAAASTENAKCLRFFSETDNALNQPWAPHKVWLNPPYGRTVGAWVRKARDEADAGAVVVMLLPVRTDTRWFHDHVLGRAEVRFLRGRVKFVGAQAGAPFPSMIVIFRPQFSSHSPADSITI